MSLNKTIKRIDSNLLILVIVTIVLLTVLSILLKGSFLSLRNFQSMAYQFPEFGLLALAMGIAMISGGIDLSVIANANLSGIIAGIILTQNISKETSGNQLMLIIIVAILSALVLSTLLGMFNGLLIAYLAIPAILATLGSMILFSGIAMAITEGVGVVGFPMPFLYIGFGQLSIFPLPLVIFLVIAMFVAIVMNRSALGQKIYLLGANPIAARFSGIENNIVTIKTYMLTGFLAGLSSIIMISRVNSAKVGYGDTYLLQAILVVVLGGIDPAGGEGKISGVILGIIILQSLQSAFTLFGFDPYSKRLIWGLMLLMVMIINFINKKHQERIQHLRSVT